MGKHLGCPPTSYVIDVGGRSEHVLIDHFKPAQRDLDQPTEVVVTPRYGRPTSVNPSGQFVAQNFPGNSPQQVTCTRAGQHSCS